MSFNELPRTNKRKSPLKYQMISFLMDYKDITLSIHCPLDAVKEVFADNGGLEWWNNKKEQV